MTPAETGIQANYWTPKYTRPKSITQRNHFAPVSGGDVPESIFDVIRKQKDLKVKESPSCSTGHTMDTDYYVITMSPES